MLKKNIFSVLLILFIFSFFSFIALKTSAQTPVNCTTNPTAVGCNTGGSGGTSVSLDNPLNPNKPNEPIAGEELWGRLIRGLLGFLGIASLVAFIFAGFNFLTAAGNPEQVKKAKDIMLYAVIGIVVALGSYAILSFIFKALMTPTS